MQTQFIFTLLYYVYFKWASAGRMPQRNAELFIRDMPVKSQNDTKYTQMTKHVYLYIYDTVSNGALG